MVRALWASDSDSWADVSCLGIVICALEASPPWQDSPWERRPLLPVPSLSGATWTEDREGLTCDPFFKGVSYIQDI